MGRVLSLEKESLKEKMGRERQKRDNSKENIQIIRSMMAAEKQREYQKAKERERIDNAKITQTLNTSLYLKRQRSLEAKLKEEESKLTKTIFLEKKRLKAQRTA